MLLLNTQLRKIPNRILEGLPEKERKLINNTTLITNSIYVYIYVKYCYILYLFAIQNVLLLQCMCQMEIFMVTHYDFHSAKILNEKHMKIMVQLQNELIQL